MTAFPLGAHHRDHVEPNRADRQRREGFFAQLGAYIVASRKAHSIAQMQLAELRKASQQTIDAYEVGRRTAQQDL